MKKLTKKNFRVKFVGGGFAVEWREFLFWKQTNNWMYQSEEYCNQIIDQILTGKCPDDWYNKKK